MVMNVSTYKEASPNKGKVVLLPTESSRDLRQAIKSLDEFIQTKDSPKKTASFDLTVKT